MIRIILTLGRMTISKKHIYFCKQFLGVNCKQCANVATRNELGRLPVKFAIETSIIKFWIHLQGLPENSLRGRRRKGKERGKTSA